LHALTTCRATMDYANTRKASSILPTVATLSEVSDFVCPDQSVAVFGGLKASSFDTHAFCFPIETSLTSISHPYREVGVGGSAVFQDAERPLQPGDGVFLFMLVKGKVRRRRRWRSSAHGLAKPRAP